MKGVKDKEVIFNHVEIFAFYRCAIFLLSVCIQNFSADRLCRIQVQLKALAVCKMQKSDDLQEKSEREYGNK